MARSQSPPGESKTPLIVGLVLSVLLLLGVGVLYYMSFEQVAAANDAKTKAEADKAKFEKDLRAEQDKVRLYRVMVGVGDEKDLTALKDTSSKEAVTAEYKDAVKRLDAAVPALTVAETKQVGVAPGAKANDVFAWPAAQAGTFDQGPPRSLAGVVLNASARQVLATRQKAQAEAREAEAAANYNKASQAYAAAVTELRKVAADLPVQAQQALAKIQADYESKASNFDARTQNYVAAQKDLSVKASDAEVKAAQAQFTLQQMTKRAQRAEGIEAAKQNPFEYEQPHGKITSRRADGTVTINIGSSDNVRPGLTFSVQPSDTPTRGLDSRKVVTAMPGGQEMVSIRDKGSVEVVSVTGPTSSTARIVGETNPVREGIMRNDVLYNPVWRKGQPDHVVLFGVFDMNADGNDDIKTLVRDLDNVGVHVDAYYDLRAQAPVGKFNQLTAVAVEGYYPVITGADGLSDAKNELSTKLNAYKDQLLGAGIKVVKARDFFPRTGYPMRLDISPRDVNHAYNPYLSSAVAAPANRK